MPAKLIFILADGLRADTARDYMGYVAALAEAGQATACTLSCALPSLSRPLYATLITGKAPVEHGIVSNDQAGERCGETLFHTLAAQGVTSVVAAYDWFYELLTGERFLPWQHRSAAVPEAGITAAHWYFADDYPDSHTLADGEALRAWTGAEFVLIHTMGTDHAGHVHGGGSDAYNLAARRLDWDLARLVPAWHAAGYHVLLTSDHGMNADRMHGGTLTVEREVPFVWMPYDHSRPALPQRQQEVRAFVEHLLL